MTVEDILFVHSLIQDLKIHVWPCHKAMNRHTEAEARYSGVVDATVRIARTEGLRGFYKGMHSKMLQVRAVAGTSKMRSGASDNGLRICCDAVLAAANAVDLIALRSITSFAGACSVSRPCTSDGETSLLSWNHTGT